MSLAEDQERLEAYVKWKAERQVTGLDISPAAYVVDRAKQEAFERVEAALGFLGGFDLDNDGLKPENALKVYAILLGEE